MCKMTRQQIDKRLNNVGVILYETPIIFGKAHKRSQRFYIVMLWPGSISNDSVSVIFYIRSILIFIVRPNSFVFDILLVLIRIVWSPSTGKELCVLLAFRLYCLLYVVLSSFNVSCLGHDVELDCIDC